MEICKFLVWKDLNGENNYPFLFCVLFVFCEICFPPFLYRYYIYNIYNIWECIAENNTSYIVYAIHILLTRQKHLKNWFRFEDVFKVQHVCVLVSVVINAVIMAAIKLMVFAACYDSGRWHNAADKFPKHYHPHNTPDIPEIFIRSLYWLLLTKKRILFYWQEVGTASGLTFPVIL